VRSNGAEANGGSYHPQISDSGRFVAFTSDASNLIGGDGNMTTDVFVHDRKNKKTVLASVAGNGTQSNNVSHFPAMANNGSVAFPSFASNLVNNDTNVDWDVFVHNIRSQKTRRVSVGNAGGEGNGSSGFFGPPKISAEGKRIAFDSQASNLVAGDTNGNVDVFLHDRANRTTRRVSVQFDGTQGNGAAFVGNLASGGRFISFRSSSTNLVGGDTNALNDVFVRGALD
jgi:Tol biopolymer transport system component